MSDLSTNLKIYQGRDEVFKLAQIPLDRLANKELKSWLDYQARSNTQLWFIINIVVAGNKGMQHNLWVLVIGSRSHMVNTVIKDGHMEIKTFDVSSKSGLQLVNTTDTSVKTVDILSHFDRGRLYESARHAVAIGLMDCLEALTKDLITPHAQKMGWDVNRM